MAGCARGTSLGADNGIGVAAMLAVLESDDIAHRRWRRCSPSTKKPAWTAPGDLAEDLLTGRFLLESGHRRLGRVYIGGAGGEDVILRRQCERREPLPPEHHAWRLTVRGLCGGHSG